MHRHLIQRKPPLLMKFVIFKAGRFASNSNLMLLSFSQIYFDYIMRMMNIVVTVNSLKYCH